MRKQCDNESKAVGKKLTNSAVEAFKGGAVYISGKNAGKLIEHPVLWCGELIGFGCRYAIKSGTRTYIYKGRVKGMKNSERTITIGRHNDPWRVDQASKRALALKQQMRDGIDPVAEQDRKQAEREQQAALDKAQIATLRQVMLDYIENKRTKHGPLRPKTKASIKDTIERYLADWLDRPMSATVTRDACLERFTELSDKEMNERTGKPGKKAAATQTFTYLRALCNFARDRYESEDGTPRIFAVNVVTRMTKVRKFNTITPRKRRIPKERIGHVWNALRKQATEGASDVLRTAADWTCFMILTGTRRFESASLKKTDVDLVARTVQLRGDVVKNHHELVLALPTQLVEILTPSMTTVVEDTPAARRRHRERSSEYLFPSFGTKRPFISDARATMRMVSEVASTPERPVTISPHDLRRTFEDIMRFAKVDPDERRLITNHVGGGDVHQTSYSNDDGADSLRASMQAAADWLSTQARRAAEPKVIQFTAKVG